MGRAKELAASLLLAAGFGLVFAGLCAALGFTLGGMLASVALIVGLVYAGATWFRAPATAAAALAAVYDQQLEIAPGLSLLSRYPESLRAELKMHCLAALSGDRVRFTLDGRPFQALPVLDADGVVRYGLLVEGSAALASTL